MKIQPYIFFRGRAQEAIDFYKTALGAEANVMRFKDSPEGPAPAPEFADRIMHADLRIGDAHILVSDGMKTEGARFEGIDVALSTPDDATTKKFFDGLSQGGKIMQPLMKTFFSSCFGVVTDKFGVGWIVLTSSDPA